MTSSQVAHCQSKLTEHCIIANKDGVSNIKKCIPVDPSIIHACVQHTYLHLHNTLYSPSEGIRKRERETGMPPWAGPGTGRETRAGFLVRLDSELYLSRPSVFVQSSI